jgi:flagellar FliL protein
MRHTSAQAAPSHSASAPVAAILHLETFTLNVDDPEQRTYLRVGIDLGLDRDPKDEKNAAPSPTAVLRDAILNVLMATKPQDVTTVEGKRKLKEQILAALKERVPELGVREIYFTEFLVQR